MNSGRLTGECCLCTVLNAIHKIIHMVCMEHVLASTLCCFVQCMVIKLINSYAQYKVKNSCYLSEIIR